VSTLSFYAILQRLIGEGRSVAVATIVRSSGSVPRRLGAKMIVAGRGETYETIGGGSFEAMVTEDALESIASGQAALKRYTFTEEGVDTVGQVCGGTVEVLIEPVVPPERLLILGAGHVGQAVAAMARGLGFEVVVVDDRPETLSADLFPERTRLILTDATFAKDLPIPDERSYVCVVTRCHRTDREALARVLAGHPRYVGLIGSERKKLAIFRELEASGIARSRLDGVHCPIGIEIGAETPAEIAVSILAEIVRERRMAQQPALSSPQPRD
jgi:xanthine dehydrogenase accessory factor